MSNRSWPRRFDPVTIGHAQSRLPHERGCLPALRSAGAKLFFLLKYSTDLNQIEQVFAKLMHLLRRAAAGTVEAVYLALDELLGSFTAAECFRLLGLYRYGLISL
jgi:transposase